MFNFLNYGLKIAIPIGLLINKDWKQILFVGKGLIMTIQITLGGLLLGLVIAIMLNILRYSACLAIAHIRKKSKFATYANFILFLIELYISLVRGTPLIIQLSLIYFCAKASVLQAGIVAFSVNSSAYMFEIIRSGLSSIPQAQFEAAYSLGIKPYLIWKDIILPQIVQNIFPNLISEVIALLKETAIIGTIGGMDLTRMAQILSAESFDYFGPLMIVGCYYYLIVLIIEILGKVTERKLFNHL